jgi:cell division protein FtsQ
MNNKFERESLGDLFQNAEIRREAISAATGETRPGKDAAPPLPAWRKKLAKYETRIAALPWGQVRSTVILLVLVATAYWGWHNRAWLNDKITTAIAEATGATVQKIEVTGLTHTAQNDLLGALGLNRGSSLVGFDASAARARIEQLPWVRLASVERQLPATVKVQIYEHLPLARLISGSSVWVLNAQGQPVVADAANAFVGLPLLQGEGAPEHAAELFGLLQPHANLLTQLREATWVGARRWDLRFVSGVTVMLPEGREAEGVNLLTRLEAARHVLTLNDGVVDLRLPDRIILRLPETVAVTPVTNQKPSPSEVN